MLDSTPVRLAGPLQAPPTILTPHACTGRLHYLPNRPGTHTSRQPPPHAGTRS
jgi:hypothetical protein